MRGIFESIGEQKAILTVFLIFVFVFLCVALHFKAARGAIEALKQVCK